MKFGKKKLFFPYLLAQYPSASEFADVFDLTMQYADAIELGIPFSDPVADGPVIREAAEDVLSAAFRIESIFQMLQKRQLTVPVALMSYANPVLAYGVPQFLKACTQCGVRGLIVPDVPWEESQPWREPVHEQGLAWICFVSLMTRAKRLEQIASSAEGFVYLLSVTGITGSDIRSMEAIREKSTQIRRVTECPVALGFGIKSPADIARLLDTADAFVVGSRIIQALSKAEPLEPLYREFRSAIDMGNAPC